MALLRSLTGVLLALMLAVTSYGFATARAHAPASHAMEICTGFSMVTIWVDENGDPVEERQICPDAVSFLADTDQIATAPLATPTLIAVLAIIAHPVFDTRHELSPSARGPPSLA